MILCYSLESCTKVALSHAILCFCVLNNVCTEKAISFVKKITLYKTVV